MVYVDVSPFTSSMVYIYPVNEAEGFIQYMLASCTDYDGLFSPGNALRGSSRQSL